MAAVYAATVHAAASGTVTFAGETPGYGKTVVVTHRFGFQTRYAHLTLIYTRKGVEVEKGGGDRVRGKHRDKYRESFAL